MPPKTPSSLLIFLPLFLHLLCISYIPVSACLFVVFFFFFLTGWQFFTSIYGLHLYSPLTIWCSVHINLLLLPACQSTLKASTCLWKFSFLHAFQSTEFLYERIFYNTMLYYITFIQNKKCEVLSTSGT